MKIKSGFKLLTVCGEHMVISEGVENINFDSIISMNDSAAYLWQHAEASSSFTVDNLIDWMLEEYDVERSVAMIDCKEIANQWEAAGLIEAD